jgi:B12-binding domain/radical SAM domain protein
LKNLLILFITSRYNRNSFAALAGALGGDLEGPFEGSPGGGFDISRLPHSIAKRSDTRRTLAADFARLPDLREYQRILLCFSFTTMALEESVRALRKIQQEIDDLRPGVPILAMAGGPHPTGDPRGTLHAGFDMVAVGEAEETFRDLVSRLLEADPGLASLPSLASLPGTACFVGGRFHFTERRSGVDINRYLPIPDRLDRPIHLEITRGCRFGCKYCQTASLFGPGERHRSPEQVARCARHIVEHGFDHVRLLAPNALAYGSRKKGEANLRALDRLFSHLRSELGGETKIFLGSFPSEVRPDYVSHEALALLKAHVANDNLILGAQSGSEAVLKRMNRGHGPAEILRSVRLTLDAGFKVYVDMMYGLPEESEAEQLESLGLTEELVRMGAKINAHTFMPLPGTPFAAAQPAPIYLAVRERLLDLAARKKLRGDWLRQEAFARRLTSGHLPQGPFQRE